MCHIICLMMHSVGTIHEASNLIFNFNAETESSERTESSENVFHFLCIIVLMKSGPSGDINSFGRERTYSN